MNQRECRIVTLHKIFERVCPEVDIDKSFLILGGIKNAAYYINIDKYCVLGCSGTNEINVPLIFDEFQIEYDVCNGNQIVSEGLNDDYVYIVPVIAQILNKDHVDFSEIKIKGQSYFSIDHVADERVYFDFIYGDPFISLETLKKLDQNDNWLIYCNYEIYCIDKKKLKNNEFIKQCCNKTKKELIQECVQTFLTDKTTEYDNGFVRVDGEKSYQIIIEHLLKARNYLEEIKDTKKYSGFIKYIYVQSIYIRKFVLGGSDAYYRNEFNSILRDEYGQEGSFKNNFKKWDMLECEWRNFGRKLCKVTEYDYVMKHPFECLDYMIEKWKFLQEKEIEAIKELKSLIM